MKYLSLIAILFSFALRAEDAQFEKLKQFAGRVETLGLENIPVKDNGRMKPLDSLARESNLFISGKKSFYGMSPTSQFLAVSYYKDSQMAQLINVRSVELRKMLGLDSGRKLFSLEELMKTDIFKLSDPAFEQQQNNKKLLTPIQTSIIECMHQINLFNQIKSGSLLRGALEYDHAGKGQYVFDALAGLIDTAVYNGSSSATASMASEIRRTLSVMQLEPELASQTQHIDLEVFYNKFNFFFFSSLIYILMTFLLINQKVSQKLNDKMVMGLAIVPLLFILLGFSFRIIITGFPPVTNMYGTMVWVSFGISLFGTVFYALYKDRKLFALMALATALLLLLTDNIPLIISPSMDPIMAVLRSSYWLTIHVLTVTISYAAFSMAMVLGNYFMVMRVLNKANPEEEKNYSHYAYRSIQLGVLLLTAGIILGGVWADYSWGRFWGWDPKETWALIADLGFLALLHGRYAGWINPKKLLLLSPLSYLLVIMAWFGVNFILSAGLHSYGFSSGGTFLVIAFIGLQLLIYVLYFLKSAFNAKENRSHNM